MFRILFGVAIALPLALGAEVAFAQGSDSELAQQLSNPIASLISVPFQFNFDQGLGAAETGKRTLVNFQPVVPFPIGEDWNVISRTIIPFIDQRDVVPGTSQSGIGDTVQSFFFSPKAPTAGGLVWGVGPVFLLPTGSSGLSANQFAAGVTGVALKQTGPWTIGVLANQLWSVGSATGGTKISATFFQPFLNYGTANAWTFAINSETSYSWIAGEDASTVVNLTVSKIVKIAGAPVSLGAGARYWADSTAASPKGWGGRISVTFLFPKGS
jgi:hypothetical protein